MRKSADATTVSTMKSEALVKETSTPPISIGTIFSI
jgi:hypothetical protein